MSVVVVSSTGKPLMPTSEYRARKLLESGRATKYSYRPFTIQITDRQDGNVQPIEICVDTGYQHIGFSVKSKKHEFLGMQVDTLSNEKEKHEKRLMYRKQRRSRKRYRAPRFNNRKRKEGWLAPSLEHRKDIHVQTIARIQKVMPITAVTLEMGTFDTQLLAALEKGDPIPQGSDYQHGKRYGIATLREAVFLRDNYTCQCCGKSIKDGAILHVHHIKYRSQGGTNRLSNLCTICDKCHTPKNHKPGGKLWDLKIKVPEYKGASYMTTVRWILYKEIKTLFPDIPVHTTYGAATKERRRILNIKKTHINDAYAMGSFHPKHRTRCVYFQKKRRNNRVLEKFYDARYIDSRDGTKKSGQELFNGRINRNHKKDSENLHPYRSQKISKGKRTIRKQRYKIQPHDIVRYNGVLYETSGCHCNGTRAILLPSKKSVQIKNLELYRYSGGYIQTKS